MRELSKLLCLALTPAVSAFDYSIIGAGDIKLRDVATGISGLETIFVDKETAVKVSGLEWNNTGVVVGSDNLLLCEAFLDGESVATGNITLDRLSRRLPDEVDCGTFKIPEGGRYTIEVKVTVDESEAATDGEYEAYGSGVAILPLLVILFLAVTTHIVELSLFVGVFLGACIITGSLNAGFTTTLDTYIVGALSDEGHVYVILFTLFLSGLVAMMEKSGGMFGFTKDISMYATTARTGQLACYCVGIMVFFDDYANTLLAGKSLRPLLDSLFVSREKLSFIVDATAAPIASISPVSSWVGFEIGLIQTELDRIIEQEGTDDIGIETSGFAVFLQSIKYRYYPIFMLVLMLIMIFAQRDFGSMLIAERKTETYKRTDGGDAATEPKTEKKTHDHENDIHVMISEDQGGMSSEDVGGDNQPRKDTPLASWNMLLPILLLIFFIFYLLIQSGDSGEPDQSIMDKIENSDSYVALLYGTMAASLVTLIFYLLQIVKDGQFITPSATAIYQALTAGSAKEKVEDAEPTARFLMSVRETIEAFCLGMGRVFPALVVLTLAWASGAIMVAVGADRLFAQWIAAGIPPESLPTLSFIISLFMALATGTSWGTMTILFPLLLLPTYNASNGDEVIFYAVVAGILSGSVAGDHMSPISDTTVLSSLACDCNLLAHVGTQAPYVLVTAIISIVLGTIPIGYDAWPNIVGILLGFVALVAFVYLICAPVVSPTGNYDIFTEFYLKFYPSEDLATLKADTVKACSGEGDGDETGPLAAAPSKKLGEDGEEPNTSDEEEIAEPAEEGEEAVEKAPEEDEEVVVEA